MWPFKKKPKKNLIIDHKIIESLAHSLKPKCPRPNDCICYDCVSRGKCVVENDMRLSSACFLNEPGIPRITGCSLQKARKGELDAPKKSRTPVIKFVIRGHGDDILDLE